MVEDRPVHDDLKALGYEIFARESECRGIRDIADGIAWRLFNYDRAVLYAIASRPASKHINVEGLQSELRELMNVFDTGEGIAVLNDLTNSLKLGDVTIRRNNGLFEFVEVKTGTKSSGRITRQRQGLRSTVEFLNAGGREQDGRREGIVEVAVEPDGYFQSLTRLLSSATKNAVVAERFVDHLMVECTDFRAASKLSRDEVRERFQRVRTKVDEWRAGGDLVLPCSGLDRYDYARNYAPFSIFPIPEAARDNKHHVSDRVCEHLRGPQIPRPNGMAGNEGAEAAFG